MCSWKFDKFKKIRNIIPDYTVEKCKSTVILKSIGSLKRLK